MSHEELYDLAMLHVRRQTANLEAKCTNGRIIVTIDESDIAAIITEFVKTNYATICKDVSQAKN